MLELIDPGKAAIELNRWIELVEKRLPGTAVFIQSCGRLLMVEEVYPYASVYVGFRGLYSEEEPGFVLVHLHQVNLSCLPRIDGSKRTDDKKDRGGPWGRVLPFVAS